MLDLDLKANSLDKVTIDSILAGSVRGNARMEHLHGISAKCMCGTFKEDQAHIFHDRPNTEAIRKPYRDAIQAVVQESVYTRQGWEDMFKSTAFHICGLVPECKELKQVRGAKEEEEGDPAEAPARQDLIEEERAHELWEEVWLRVCIDGSVSDPSDLRLALGGCAIYCGHNHSYNTATRVHGRRLNSYRAELQAVRLLI